MIQFTCKECGHVQEVGSTTIRFIGGEIRRDGDVCEECGGICDHTNPKKGVPSMQFTDSGTGKKKIL